MQYMTYLRLCQYFWLSYELKMDTDRYIYFLSSLFIYLFVIIFAILLTRSFRMNVVVAIQIHSHNLYKVNGITVTEHK